jgi:hypothetical protein
MTSSPPQDEQSIPHAPPQDEQPPQGEQSVPREARTLDRLSLTLEEKQLVERKWQALAQQGVQIEVDTSGSDGLTFQCRLWHKTAGELLFQTPLSCTFRWEKRFFVHSSQNKKEAKLEAKIYVFQHIQTLRISSSHVDMKLYPDAKFLR